MQNFILILFSSSILFLPASTFAEDLIDPVTAQTNLAVMAVDLQSHSCEAAASVRQEFTQVKGQVDAAFSRSVWLMQAQSKMSVDVSGALELSDSLSKLTDALTTVLAEFPPQLTPFENQYKDTGKMVYYDDPKVADEKSLKMVESSKHADGALRDFAAFEQKFASLKLDAVTLEIAPSLKQSLVEAQAEVASLGKTLAEILTVSQRLSTDDKLPLETVKTWYEVREFYRRLLAFKAHLAFTQGFLRREYVGRLKQAWDDRSIQFEKLTQTTDSLAKEAKSLAEISNEICEYRTIAGGAPENPALQKK